VLFRSVFRFWTGEDTDASVVVDEQGMLYVNTEGERHNNRSKKVGHLMKLDPSKWTSANPDAAIVWSFAGDSFDGNKDGFWSTPAIYGNLLIAGRTRGQLYAFDRTTGAEVWKKQLPAPTDQSMWASPVVVDRTLIQADCVGQLHAFDLSNPGVDPPELWSVKVPSDSHCIETTPTVFDGKIYLGSRNGYLYAFGD
jgi:outer membrane protein assembly factor BamB